MSMPLSIQRIKVRSLDRDYHEVSWETDNTEEDVFDYTFQVLRSEAAMGPFETISPPFQDRYLFIDNQVVTGDRWRFLHYQVRLTHVPSGEIRDFGPARLEPDPDLIALELRRHIVLLHREFAGRMCWVLPVRTFGQRCDCWSPTIRKTTRSRCPRCFDTSFVRGYMHPVEAWIQFDPSPNANQYTNVGAQQQQNTTARLGYFPPLKPNDLIVEPENRRWRVVQTSQTEQGRAAVRQEVALHEIPMRDIEFAIPLELGKALRDIWFSPPRNFTNPQNLEAVDEQSLDVFSLYRFGEP